MIIFFNIKDPNGVERRVSAICPPSTTGAGAATLLRNRLNIPNTVSVILLLENEIQIKHMTAPLTSLRKQRGGVKQVLQMHLWAEFQGAEEDLSVIDYSALEDISEEEDEGQDLEGTARRESPGVIRPSPPKGINSRHQSPLMEGNPVPVKIRRPTGQANERVTKRNPRESSNSPIHASGRPSGHEKPQSPLNDGELELTSNVREEQVKGRYRTGYARRDIPLAGIIMKEYPKLCNNDPSQIVAAVKDDARLNSRTYNRDFSEKSANDLSDEEYSKYLSIGVTYAVETRAGTGIGQKTAFYGEILTLRHSCRPNATAHYDVYTAPYTGSCRCATFNGLKKGEEITVLYRHADSQAFLLLSRERRQNLLKRKYFFDCDCERCSMQVSNRSDDLEAKLTGVFFSDSSVDTDPAKQKELSEEMHADFSALALMDDSGVEITLSLPGNVPPMTRTKQCNRILGFIRKYTGNESPLRLHESHWRVNLARAAYIQETVRLCAIKGATPEARRKDPMSRSMFTPTKTVYDLCLKQLVVENSYIPRGHPHRLTTFESFQFLVAILPGNIASSTLKNALSNTKIDWKGLEETKSAWDIFKRASLPPNVRKSLSRQEASH
ncbi:hypothetical protein ADEAN_000423600 [Angomonas deanei]|uniref:SET domain containing protein n=1 Tax=Angomonas deanei TaxID=59799 RepID=A0A7G2CDI9_9TRYP|nr:hypothetical protein ADEAN_000423600 [Angomonas deanei]